MAKSKMIQTYIDMKQQEYAEFGAYARLDGLSIGALLGQLARRYLKRKQGGAREIGDDQPDAK